MKRIMLTLCAALFVPAVLFADSHEMPAELSDVWMIAPKAGMAEQFEAALKAHIEHRAAQGDTRDWAVYTPVIGDKLGIYQIRYCCFDWADQDGYIAESTEKGFGDHWNQNVDQYVDHYHHYFEKNDWENSWWPEGEGEGPYFGVTSWQLKMNTGSGPSEARKALSKMAMDEGWAESGDATPWLWLSRVGGKPMLMIVSPFENFADMAPPEQGFYDWVVENKGAEEAEALFGEFGSSFASSDYTVWYYHEDLSIQSDED